MCVVLCVHVHCANKPVTHGLLRSKLHFYSFTVVGGEVAVSASTREHEQHTEATTVKKVARGERATRETE